MPHRAETLIGNVPAKPYADTLYAIDCARKCELAGGQAYAWSESFMTSDRFENFFYYEWPASVQKAKGIDNWLKNKKEQEGRSYLLNFMGSTVVLDNLQGSYTAGIAMCLTDIAQPWHEKQGIHVVDGNVLLEETWDNLRTTMKRFSIPGFSLILSAPRDGFLDKYITDNIDVSWEIYNRLYNLLLPDSIMMIQTTEVLGKNREFFETWIKTIAGVCPQDPPVRSGYQKFSLVKTDALPALPKFPVK